jgi:hypothetical protein
MIACFQASPQSGYNTLKTIGYHRYLLFHQITKYHLLDSQFLFFTTNSTFCQSCAEAEISHFISEYQYFKLFSFKIFFGVNTTCICISPEAPSRVNFSQ